MYIRNNYVVIYIYLLHMYIRNNYVVIYIYSYTQFYMQFIFHIHSTILTNSMDNEVYAKFQEPLLELSTN